MKVKSFGKKIIISILTSTFALFAFTASTFAWFNLTDFGVLSGLELSVSSDKVVAISLDGINFSDVLTSKDIGAYIGDVMMDNLTSLDGKTFSHNEGESVVPNGNYISFPLWFRSVSRYERNLYLVDNITERYNYNVAREYELEGTFVFSKGVDWIADVTFDNGGENLMQKGTKATYYGADAIRVGIVESNVEEELLIKKDERTNLQSKIFDLTGDEERGYGSTIGAYDRAKQFSDIAPALPTAFPDTVYELTTFKNPYEAYNNNSLVATFQEGKPINDEPCYYAKIQVNVWIEGWDADCFDAIYLDKLIMQLSFRASNLIRTNQ